MFPLKVVVLVVDQCCEQQQSFGVDCGGGGMSCEQC